MRWPRTLSLYVAREIGLFGGLSFLGVAFLLVSQQLVDRLDELLGLGLGGSDLPRLLLLTLTVMSAHALPIAFVFGVALALGRMSAASELVAIKSLGVGIGSITTPVLAIGGTIALGTFWLLADVEPSARLQLRQHLADVALRGTIVKEGRFRGLRDRVIYVDARSPDGELRGVMIHDSTQPDRPYVTFAETGSLQYDERAGMLHLRLDTGQILLDPDVRDPERVQLVSFDRFHYSFDALSLLRGRYHERNPDELSTDELYDVIERIDTGAPLRAVRTPYRIRYAAELERRRIIPLAPVFVGAIAVAFGAGRRRSRSIALLVSATAVFGYYGTVTLGLQLATETGFDPRIAAAAIVAAFTSLATLLLWRLARSSGE